MDEMLAMEYLQQAEVLLSQKQYENAIVYLKKAEKENPFNREIYINMGVSYANTEEYDQAEKSLQKALKLNKEDSMVYFHLGNIYFLKDDKSRGMQYYNQAIAKGYEGAQMYFSLGLMFEEEGDNSLALRNYSKAIIQDPLRGDARIRKAQLYIKNKQYPEALQTLDEMIIACPDIFEGYHMKFIVLNGNGEYDKAEELLERAKKLFPNDLGFVLDQASLYTSRKRFDEALELLNEIENQDEDGFDHHGVAVERARIHALKGDMNKTIHYLKEAKRILKEMDSPQTDPEANFFLMNCYINIENYENAVLCAKELNEDENNGYYGLAAYYYEPYCMQKLNRDKEAVVLYQKGVEALRNYSLKNSNNIDSYLYRILCLNELKKYEKALELSDYLIMIKGDSPEVHTIRGIVLTAMGRGEEANKEKSKARSLGGMLAVLPANQE